MHGSQLLGRSHDRVKAVPAIESSYSPRGRVVVVAVHAAQLHDRVARSGGRGETSLNASLSSTGRATVSGCETVERAKVRQLLRNLDDFYVNVHLEDGTVIACGVLERKGLVRKSRAVGDGRALAARPTPKGRLLAGRLALWPDFLLAALGELDEVERDVFQRALVKMIRSLQVRGRIPVARMCVGCQFFRPHAHADARAPHHCAFVDAPFGDRELRIDCADHVPLPPDEADALWRELDAGAAGRSRKETR